MGVAIDQQNSTKDLGSDTQLWIREIFRKKSRDLLQNKETFLNIDAGSNVWIQREE